MSALARFTTEDQCGIASGRTIHIPGLFYRFDNSRCEAGHIRLFGKPLKGTPIYMYNRTAPGWALTRVWYILGLIAIIHVDAGLNDELKHCSKPGWHFRFAKIKLARIYRGWSLQFLAADKGYTA